MGISKLNHTQISNDFLDNYLHKISSKATKIFLVISRKTIGWHKESDRITLTQIIKISGMSKNTVRTGIKELLKKDIIIVDKSGYGKGQQVFYSINYNDLWVKN